MSKKIKYFSCFLIIIFVWSCKKDVPPQKDNSVLVTGGQGNVYILNEGNFSAGNASISQLNLNTGNVVADAYSTANTSNTLGDVLQSMFLLNNKYYLCINNSSKIKIVNKSNFTDAGSILNLTSPRYFLPVSANKAYVSDLYANAISIIDLSANTKTGSIPLNGWTEEMVLSFGNVFVCNKTKNYVYIINAATDFVMDSLNVGYGAGSIVEDINGKLWVLAQGDAATGQLAKLSRINPISKTIDSTVVFGNTLNAPYKIKINGTKDNLYWIDYNGIYSMNISTFTLPNTSLIAQGSKIFYGLGVDPIENIIYVADAIDYNQNGKIYRYHSNGVNIDNFTAGIIPGDIYFEK